MGLSPYLRGLRARIGHNLVQLPAVAVMIFDDADRLLLVRASDTGQWQTVGGAIDPDEQPADAAVREAYEETGLEVELSRLIGVYGVVGFMVATRTREIGVRMALGATRLRVLRTVLTDAIQVVVPGVSLGLVLAVVVVRFANLPETWYDLGAVEAAAYAVAAAVAVAVALLAGLPSARRAMRINPIQAMRSE